jgi:hypothetical protein
MTPYYYTHRRAYTSTQGKYRALLAQGIDPVSAARMANSLDIPKVYGPTKRSRRVLTDDDYQQTVNETF